VNVRKFDLEILTDLHVSSPLNANKWFMECHLSLCIWMCALLVPERVDRFYSYLVCKSLSILGSCSVNLNIPCRI
jgi:hypothetical protein